MIRIKTMTRLIIMTVIAFVSSMDANAIIQDDIAKVDGVRYRTNYYPDNNSYYGDEYDSYTLENVTDRLINFTAGVCKAERNGRTFRFYDGSEIPAFQYPTQVIQPLYSEGEYSSGYTGEIWLQDSVKLKALPCLSKTRYHIICDMNKYIFDRKRLKFIRTPRYMVVRSGLFKDFPGLHTARIGAAQLVETGAFENCSALGTVFFETAPYVRDDAFKNCPNIRYVVMDGKLPKPCDEYKYGYDEEDRSPFDAEIYDKAILYVHEDQMEAFRQDKTWGKFKNIRDIEEYMTGVENITPDTAVEYQVFDLSGTQVRSVHSGENWREGLPSGLYIVKSSLGTVHKELIK